MNRTTSLVGVQVCLHNTNARISMHGGALSTTCVSAGNAICKHRGRCMVLLRVAILQHSGLARDAWQRVLRWSCDALHALVCVWC